MYRIRAITAKTNYFHTFWLIWPCCDLETTMTWPWGNTVMEPHPSPCHHVCFSWASSPLKEVLVIGPNMTIYLLFGPFLSYEMGMTWRSFWRVLPSNPHITPCNLLRCVWCNYVLGPKWVSTVITHRHLKCTELDVFGVTTSWGLSGFQPSLLIDISNVQN